MSHELLGRRAPGEFFRMGAGAVAVDVERGDTKDSLARKRGGVRERTWRLATIMIRGGAIATSVSP
jgi:hypothetical protein